MDNLISVFMNYKVNRLIEYGVAIYQNDSPFIRSILTTYFQTYIDNYYYGVFNTIEDTETYNRRNLKTELTGIMDEMLYDYEAYQETLPKEEYQENRKIIHDLRDLVYEVVRIDTLNFTSKDELPNELNDFVVESDLINEYLGGRLDKLVRLVRDTYVHEQKMLQFEDKYFEIAEKHFQDADDCVWLVLKHKIQSLEVYRKGLVEKVFEDEKYTFDKFECLIQKISRMLLMNFLNHQENKKIIIHLPDEFVSRGKIDARILSLIDNPMFQRNVILAVQYNTYLNQKSAFLEDYHFACMQDFSHINDVYQKVEGIYNEGFSHYLIVLGCKEDDRDFFDRYKNDVMRVLMFEEE